MGRDHFLFHCHIQIPPYKHLTSNALNQYPHIGTEKECTHLKKKKKTEGALKANVAKFHTS